MLLPSLTHECHAHRPTIIACTHEWLCSKYQANVCLEVYHAQLHQTQPHQN